MFVFAQRFYYSDILFVWESQFKSWDVLKTDSYNYYVSFAQQEINPNEFMLTHFINGFPIAICVRRFA